MSENLAEILNKAADLLDRPGAWTQGAWARLPNGEDANPHEDERSSPGAICFCLWGSIRQVWDRPGRISYAEITAIGIPDTSWNDAPERTQAEVVAVLRKAAALFTPRKEE